MSKKVIDLGQYSLVADYISMFNGKNDNSSESIFDFQTVAQAGGFFSPASEAFISATWSPTVPWANWYTPSEQTKGLFVAGDIRRKSLLVAGATPADMVDIDGTGPKVFPSSPMRTSYFNNAAVRKFLPEGKLMSNVANFDVNYPIIRYAEVLLNYAEALNELGQSPAALVPLNQIRKRAGVADITVTGQAALRTLIQDERRDGDCWKQS
jgi:hypothetical protein